MKWDLLPYVSYLWSTRLAMLTNIGYAVSALCYLIIFLKIKQSPGGAFRLYLLGYFGAATLTSFCMAFYHPLYNFWLLPVAHSGVFVALLALTWYILNEFWSTKSK